MLRLYWGKMGREGINSASEQEISIVSELLTDY